MDSLTKMKESLLRLFGKDEQQKLPNHNAKIDAIDKELRSIFNICNSPLSTPFISLRMRQEAFRRLQRVMQVATDSQLNHLEMKLMLWPAVSMYCYFRITAKRKWSLKERLRQWWRRNDLRTGRFYQHVVQRLLKCESFRHQAVVSCIFHYLSEFGLWRRQTLTVLIILRPMVAGVPAQSVLNLLLDRLLVNLETHESRYVVRVMYEIFDFYDWPPLNESAGKAITRLLKIYRRALRLEYIPQHNPLQHCTALRKGLEVTVRHIIEHLLDNDIVLVINYMVEWFFDERNTEEIILTFGSVLEHAALIHNTEAFKYTFLDKLFENILQLVGSSKRVVCHLGNRILQHLLDRHHNRRQFSSPRIFFQNSHFNVTVATLLPEDREFLKKHRLRFHRIFLRALIEHSHDREMLESIYATVCLLATEIPCSYSAVVMANFAINVQGLAIDLQYIQDEVRYHLHVFTMGLMSLICWLYNAADFYKYVNKVINRRAEYAPHLNPPLRSTYTFATHCVLWTDPTLYFDVWEVRYSLWMRFKIKHAQAFLEAMGATSPPTAKELKEALESGLEPSLVAQVLYPTRRQILQPFLPQHDGKLAAGHVTSTDCLEVDEDPRLLDLFIHEPTWSLQEKGEVRGSVRDRDIKPLPQLLEDQ